MIDSSVIQSEAVRSGLNYEQKIFDILFPIFGEGNMSERVAFNSLRPDIILKNKRKNIIRFELKANLSADYGEKGITIDKESHKWIPVKSPIKDKSNRMHVEYAERLDELYTKIFEEEGLHTKIVNSWKLPSEKNKGMDVNALLSMIERRELSKSLYYERLLNKLENKFDPYQQITLVRNVSDKVVSYYNSKNVYYIQIKDKGLYILGNDAYLFNQKFSEMKMDYNIPRFHPSECRIELRGKTSRSGQTFRPVIRFKISGLSKSQVSLEDPIFANALHEIMWQ